MQRGDTDLILCLSTCTYILTRSATALSGTQEASTLFVQSLGKKKEEGDTSCLTEVTSLPKSPEDINRNVAGFCSGDSVEMHISRLFFFGTETMRMLRVGLTSGADSRAHALKVNCEGL